MTKSANRSCAFGGKKAKDRALVLAVFLQQRDGQERGQSVKWSNGLDVVLCELDERIRDQLGPRYDPIGGLNGL